MMAATDLAGLTGVALASAIVLTLPMKKPSLFALIVVFAALWLPFDGLPLAAYLRGMVGDLSIASLLLALSSFQRRRRAAAETPQALCWLLAAAAIALYPLALGAGPFDPYRWGYGEPLFLAVLLALALYAQWRRLPLVAPVIALAVLAWAAGLHESTNLWDYLLDPLAAGYAVARSTLSWRRARP